MTQTISRKELYETVWQKPMIHAAKEFGLSDTGLRKICVNHEIPAPRAGYWAKLNAGKPVQQTPLPPASDERLNEVVIYSSALRDIGQNVKDAGLAAAARARSISARKAGTELHPTAQAVSAAFQQTEESDGRLKICIDDCFRIDITPSAVARAIDLVNTIFWMAEELGYEWQKSTGGAKLIVDGQPLGLSLREDLRSKDKLTLSLDDHYHTELRRNWTDGKRRRIEDQLPDFLRGVAMYAAAEKERTENRLRREASLRNERPEAREDSVLPKLERERQNAAQACIDTMLQIEQYEALLATLKSQSPDEEVDPSLAAFMGWIETRLKDWRYTLSPQALSGFLRQGGLFE